MNNKRWSFFRTLVKENNLFWNQLFYSHNYTCDDFDLYLQPKYPHLQILNAASALNNLENLSQIETIFANHHLTTAIWAYDDISLHEKGYQISKSDTEIWCAFDLQKEVPTLPLNQANIVRNDTEFARISTLTNSCSELSDLIIERLKSAENIDPLLITLNGTTASTLCLGHMEKNSYLCLGGTLPGFRRQGLFQFSLVESIKRAQKRGSQYLISTIEQNNHASLTAGQQLGFQALFTQQLWMKHDNNTHQST